MEIIKIKSGNKEGSICSIINSITQNLVDKKTIELQANNKQSNKLISVVEILKRELGNSIIIKYNIMINSNSKDNNHYLLAAVLSFNNQLLVSEKINKLNKEINCKNLNEKEETYNNLNMFI